MRREEYVLLHDQDETTLNNSLTPQPKEQPRILSTFLSIPTTREISDVGVTSQRVRNLPARINPANLNQPTSSLGHGLADNIRTLSFTLGADNVCLTLLLGPLDNEPRAFGVLLRDLLLLNGLGELPPERHVRDGDILESDVELRGAFHQVRADPVRHGFTLGDQFGGVKLGDDSFEDFVADGGEDTFVVVNAVRLFITLVLLKLYAAMWLTW